MLYGTTKEFLKVFGLSGLDDLPKVEGAERPKPTGQKERGRVAADARDDQVEDRSDPAQGSDEETGDDESASTEQAAEGPEPAPATKEAASRS
jgi:hypothetical protein